MSRFLRVLRPMQRTVTSLLTPRMGTPHYLLRRNVSDNKANRRLIAHSAWQFQKISQSDRQLVDFLAVEIVEERRDQLQINAPLMLDDFVAIFRGSEVELVKDIGRERISIYFNISKSVPRRIGDSITPVRSVPRFEVVIQRGDCRLSICCSYVLSAWENGVLVRRPLEGSDTEYEDVFEISEISLYENDWNDCYYTMDDTLIDDNLYLLIMDVLAEKGITNEFVIKMSDLATAHEHATYIEFLENLSKFAVGLPLPYNDNTFYK